MLHDELVGLVMQHATCNIIFETLLKLFLERIGRCVMDDEIRILIVDDHPIVREGWRAVLDRRPDMVVVGEGANGVEGLALFEELRPDITLVDLRMPQMDGVTLIQKIREVEPEARIIILTTFDGDEDIFRALQAGGMAYLLKDTPRGVLLETIRKVHGGEKYIPPAVASKLTERMMAEELTERELEVLKLIAKGFSNRAIGNELHIAEGTVKAHVNNILGKLGANDRTQAVTVALQRGIIRLA